jgi:hypothetical protein
MSITDYFKEHAIRDYKVIKYENTFVRLLYKIIFYLQNKKRWGSGLELSVFT